ncbi:MAG: hypothetical protein JSR39_08215 [Verrucomicrobia bacterium]|nr:hypothetical protein [Verrucomicrobiota bacterium]
MALKTGAISSASNELAQLLVQDMDVVRGQNREVQENLRQGTFTPQTFEMAAKLAGQVNAMVSKLNQFGTSISSMRFSAVDESAQGVLRAQYDAFKGQVEQLFHSSKYTLRDVRAQASEEVQKLFPVFEKAVGQYLETRAIADLAPAKETSSNLAWMVRAVKWLGPERNQWEGRRIEYDDGTDLLCERFQNLKLLVDVPKKYNPYEAVMVELDQVMAGDVGADLDLSRRKWRSLVDLSINRLHAAVGSDLVNYWVWKLGGEKSGENYGLVHRYDDPVILNEAIRHTMQAAAPKLEHLEGYINLSLETYLPLAFEGYFDLCQGKNENRERMDIIIDRLHQEMGSDLVNYWVWKLGGEKPEANYGVVHRYDDLSILREAVHRATQALADKLIEKQSGKVDRQSLLKAFYIFLGEPQVENPTVWMQENACYYTENIWMIEEDVVETLMSRSGAERKGEVKPHEFTQVLEQLEELGNQPITPELQKRVEAMIAMLARNGLEDTINYEIWRLGGEKAGDNWGVVHRYDDLNVLRQALMIAIRRDVHEQFVVKRFDKEEDRNVFYIEIAKIARPSELFLRMNDDYLPYGKEMVVFYLHHLERAAEAVCKSVE